MKETYVEDIQQIRSMMARSSRFMSLSGLSGVIAGVAALVGSWIAWREIMSYTPDRYTTGYYEAFVIAGELNMDLVWFCVIDAILILMVSITAGILLTVRKAKRDQAGIWSKPAQLLLQSLFIPLMAGGGVCLILLKHGHAELIAPLMLIFYGIGLESASKYTLKDVHYLGISEIILGLVSLFFLKHGLLFWSIGFGIMHTLYGSMMYFKYERK
jgi:hypothetical protein